MRNRDLLQGDLGYVAYFFGYIVMPICLAIGGGRIGNELLGQPALGWVIGGVGFVIGLAIGQYAAVGALYALFFGMVGGLAGLGIDWLGGWQDKCVFWGMLIGGGAGFLLGVIGCLVNDRSSARQNPPGALPADDSNATAASEAPPIAPVVSTDAKILVRRANIRLLVIGGGVLLASPFPFFWFLSKPANESGSSITVGIPVLLVGIIASFVCFDVGSARYQCPVCKKNLIRSYEGNCSECGGAVR